MQTKGDQAISSGVVEVEKEHETVIENERGMFGTAIIIRIITDNHLLVVL